MRGGFEKAPIWTICGTLRKFWKSRIRSRSVASVPLTFTTPKAAISAFSGAGSGLVTTSPLSIAASWASPNWMTLRRKGRGGASCASTSALAAVAMPRANAVSRTIVRIENMSILRV